MKIPDGKIQVEFNHRHYCDKNGHPLIMNGYIDQYIVTNGNIQAIVITNLQTIESIPIKELRYVIDDISYEAKKAFKNHCLNCNRCKDISNSESMICKKCQNHIQIHRYIYLCNGSIQCEYRCQNCGSIYQYLKK